ncbi:hypothetical protein DNHGIG_31560 [Collibacillus ludicampi]|uniref:Uncharacterized protein n=1 Tax=Collibacillus ludicampi TaxID=2771369 RepID=A0AAV4LJQ5_9BACL|nr:hypothetical protein [Collibacillus ludicampi]GIM47607.1 hypothetical protein DNHGIG_31560 [Collibacillus ludicampi]
MREAEAKIIEFVKGLSEKEAKERLAKIFILVSSIGYGGYTKEKCFDDIRKMYLQDVALNGIFENEKL